MTIKTLYDGEHFGDLNLSQNPERKRAGTCFCSEESYLLAINQDLLFELLVIKSEKNQNLYYKFLRNLSIFEVFKSNEI